MDGENPSKRSKYDAPSSPNPPTDSSYRPSASPIFRGMDDECVFLLKQALTSFNDKEGTNFNFLKLVNKGVRVCGVKIYAHVNFVAINNGDGSGGSSSGAVGSGGAAFGSGATLGCIGGASASSGGDGLPPQIFFAEIVCTVIYSPRPGVSEDDSTQDYLEYKESSVEVTGLSLLEKVDTGNPMGMACFECDDEAVIHPGPRSGYRILAGDKFESAEFHVYNLYKVFQAEEFESPWGRSKVKHTSDRLPMLTSCAKCALEHFNKLQETEFCLVEVDIGYSISFVTERLVHLNFLAKRPESDEKPLLFFAAVRTPMCTPRVPRMRLDWDVSLEPCIEVEGCCVLTKRETGSEYFGRICELCTNGVMHPGPRDGYNVAAGDDFKDAQFMEIGSGIF